MIPRNSVIHPEPSIELPHQHLRSRFLPLDLQIVIYGEYCRQTLCPNIHQIVVEFVCDPAFSWTFPFFTKELPFCCPAARTLIGHLSLKSSSGFVQCVTVCRMKCVTPRGQYGRTWEWCARLWQVSTSFVPCRNGPAHLICGRAVARRGQTIMHTDEEGRITSRGHSQRGAIAATRILGNWASTSPRESKLAH